MVCIYIYNFIYIYITFSCFYDSYLSALSSHVFPREWKNRICSFARSRYIVVSIIMAIERVDNIAWPLWSQLHRLHFYSCETATLYVYKRVLASHNSACVGPTLLASIDWFFVAGGPVRYLKKRITRYQSSFMIGVRLFQRGFSTSDSFSLAISDGRTKRNISAINRNI